MTKSRSKVGNMAIKIDLEKAYDRLEWSFIRLTLQHFNLPQWWVDLIMSCISCSHLSILVNGEKTESFAPSRGIRQGDPLSPYIFILCMEFLAWLIQGEVHNGNWKGIKVSQQGPIFSHIFFADDLVLFAKATKANCYTINKVLNTFCQASGQKISTSKSRVYMHASTNPSRIAMVESELGFKISKEFGKYLGVPIITDARDKHAFDYLIEKVRDKLAGWKAKTLSMAGRCTLINSVSSAIPTHVMQCCLLPPKVCANLDKLNRNFLWGDTSAKKKIHLMKWDLISRPKDEGGLGIKRSRCRNKALLAKRMWALRLGSEDVWALSLRNKYPPTRSRFCQKSITWKSLKQANHICDKGMGHLIQNGRTIKFWTDNWLDSGPLRNLISGPLLHHEESLHLNEVWDSSGSWCLDTLSMLLPPSIINTILAVPRPITSPLEDGICWKPSSNGLFSSASAYKIALNLDQTLSPPGCWRWIWKLNTLPRIIFFIWQLCHEKLPTKILLAQWKITPDNICPLCNIDPESCLHLFRDCPVIQPLWHLLGFTATSHFFTQTPTRTWAKHWSLDTTAPSLFPQFQWKDIFPVLIWTIWTGRNKWVMEHIPLDIPSIIHRTKTITTELCFNLPRKEPNNNIETILVNWKPPPPNFFKLNTDGSVTGNPGPAGAGGIIRDHTGNWVKGFSRKIGNTNSLAAELWGLRDGLVLAQELNIKRLIIELDAKAILDLVQTANLTSLSYHPYGALISDCRSLIQAFEETRLQHTYREGNATADLLAKAGASLFCPFVVFDHPPLFIVSQILADSQGVQYPRLM
uniref:Reverse transcriptase domain-containing protein n=1 Tax=Fagus sylvatica TaxID=28930 RepID=A0A2N9IHI9_FAGSY